MRTAAVTAGIGLLLMSVLAAFGKVYVLDGLVTQGNAAQTAKDIIDSDGMFQLGIVSLFAVIVLDVIVAWALYYVFRPVSRSVSLLTAWLRVLYSGIFLVAVGHLAGVPRLLGGAEYGTAFGVDQLQSLALLEINTFTDIWRASLFLFGLHLLLLGYLAYKSGYVPRFLGVLLAIAGMGYMVDSFVAVLYQGSWTDISNFTFIGEFLLALWLVIRGRRLTVSESGLHDDPIAAER